MSRRTILHWAATTLVSGVVVWGLHAQAVALQPDLSVPDPGEGYDWKEAASKAGLAASDVERLAAAKILVSNEAFKQVFTPYIESDLPVFITSDSLLAGFHVLFEESVRRLEEANGPKLLDILRFVWENLDAAEGEIGGKPELAAAAKTRARVVIGTAVRLMGDDTIRPDPGVAALISEEVARVEEAAGQLKPEWLGPPDRGFVALEYTRYKPRGFYTSTEPLQRYFRAVSWLQSIPFRVNKDEELLSALILGSAASQERFRDHFAKAEEFEQFFRCCRDFLGTGDDWDLTTAAHEAGSELPLDLDGEGLSEIRQRLLDRANARDEGPRISDQIAFGPDDPTKTAEVSFRVLPAYRTPDAVLFQRTTDLRKFRRDFPTGLEVCAALGSSYARTRVAKEEPPKVMEIVDESRALFLGSEARSRSSLYREYFWCLAALIDDAERGAPAFVSGEAWQIKSCQTVLSGWVQLRHTWALQAKPSAHYWGGSMLPPGFVEPEPEFFARLAGLLARARVVFREAGAFTPDLKGFAADLDAAADLLESKGATTKGREAIKDLSGDEMLALGKIDFLPWSGQIKSRRDDDADFFSELIAKARELARDLRRGQLPDDPLVAKSIREAQIELAPLWYRLEILCRRLEALAHKQLRGIPLSEDEKRFITAYGEELAAVMLYAGNSYLTPRDDAPRVVDVHHNPNVARHLHVGIARPRALYVLYPLDKGEVLCRGAVMPYYEFEHGERLTDTDWKSLLDSDKRPETPSWTGPIISTGGIRTAKPKPDY